MSDPFIDKDLTKAIDIPERITFNSLFVNENLNQYACIELSLDLLEVKAFRPQYKIFKSGFPRGIPSHPGSSKETKGLWVQWGYFYEQIQYNSTTTLFIMIKGFVKMPISIMVLP